MEENSITTRYDEGETQSKIKFKLVPDQDGYPPDEWETLWATKREDGNYVIDSIPFFICEISVGDIVSVTKNGANLFFDNVVERSPNSVLRVISFNDTDVPELRGELEKLGCETEGSHIENLFSINIPGVVDTEPTLSVLDRLEAKGVLEYEIASMRH